MPNTYLIPVGEVESQQEMLTKFLFDTNHNKEEMERRKEWMYQLWRARQMKMVEKKKKQGRQLAQCTLPPESFHSTPDHA